MGVNLPNAKSYWIPENPYHHLLPFAKKLASKEDKASWRFKGSSSIVKALKSEPKSFTVLALLLLLGSTSELLSSSVLIGVLDVPPLFLNLKRNFVS